MELSVDLNIDISDRYSYSINNNKSDFYIQVGISISNVNGFQEIFTTRLRRDIQSTNIKLPKELLGDEKELNVVVKSYLSVRQVDLQYKDKIKSNMTGIIDLVGSTAPPSGLNTDGMVYIGKVLDEKTLRVDVDGSGQMQGKAMKQYIEGISMQVATKLLRQNQGYGGLI